MGFWRDADSCEITGPMSSLTSTTASLSGKGAGQWGESLRLLACIGGGRGDAGRGWGGWVGGVQRRGVVPGMGEGRGTA